MEPIQLGPLRVWPFGLAVAVLLLPFYALAARGMKKSGLSRETASWFALVSLPLCLLLSRFSWCLLNLDQLIGRRDPGVFFRFSEGGFLLWGAVAGVPAAAALAGKITKQPAGKIADSVVLPLCLLLCVLRLLGGLLFRDLGIGLALEEWFAPWETDPASRYSLFRPENWSFFERFPFAVLDYYDTWCWAVFVLQALWAGICALLLRRVSAAPGGKTVLFFLLYAAGSIVTETMLIGGYIPVLPWLGFVKANLVLWSAALLVVFAVCLRRLPAKLRLGKALAPAAVFLAAAGVTAIAEFAAFEKKIPEIAWLPADAWHLLTALAWLFFLLSFRALWRKAFIPENPQMIGEPRS